MSVNGLIVLRFWGPSVCLSVCPSVCPKNFNLGHNFCTFTGRALILGMCVLFDKTFPMVPCCDLDGDLWHTSRSNLLPSGGPQFSEFFLWGTNFRGFCGESNPQIQVSTKYLLSLCIIKENIMATNFEPHKCAILVQSMKIGTQGNKAIHSILT